MLRLAVSAIVLEAAESRQAQQASMLGGAADGKAVADDDAGFADLLSNLGVEDPSAAVPGDGGGCWSTLQSCRSCMMQM